MFRRYAARPLALCSTLFLFACDSDDDGNNAGTDSSSTGSETTASETTGSGSEATTDTASTGGGDGSTTTTGGSGDESSTGVGDSSSSGGDESSSTGETAVGIADVAGTYIETYGPGEMDFQTHFVTATDWTIDFGGKAGMAVHTYEEIDDDARWVAGDDGVGTYTRYDWDIDDDGNLRYCTAVFGAETLQVAIDAPPSDREDFDGIGCGGAFPWSVLVLDEG